MALDLNKKRERERRWKKLHPLTDEQRQKKNEQHRQWRLKNIDQIKLKDKEYREKNRSIRIENSRQWRIANPKKKLLNAAKQSSKKRSIIFDLSIDDIPTLPSYCPILGIPLNYLGGKRSDNTASLDRIDNTKGYVKGNIHIISWRANNMKRDMTFEEIQSFAFWWNKRPEAYRPTMEKV